MLHAMLSPILPSGSTILVTGVNGFIASHIADQLLEDGYLVRGSVRSEPKGESPRAFSTHKYGEGKFEIVVIPDITQGGAFNEALRGVSGIIHTATAATLAIDPNQVIPPTVAGALNIFNAASKEPGIRSVVYTSDSFAALLPQPNRVVHVMPSTYNKDSVAVAANPASFTLVREQAWDKANAVELNVYAAAKVAAEKAIWQFVEEQKPCFQVSTILPNVNLGGSIAGLPLASTGSFVPKLLAGETSGLFFPAQHYVNVRDCAKLHVAALLDAERRNQRIFAMAAPFNWNDVLAILRKLKPDANIVDDMQDLGRDLSVVPTEAAEQLLTKHYGHSWTSLEESVRQNLEMI